MSTTCKKQEATRWRPDDPNDDFKRCYQEVKKGDYIPYPGKRTEVQTLRVGEAGIPRAVAAIADTLKAMDVRRSRLSAEAAA